MCPRCAAPVDDGARFCGTCGTALTAESDTLASDLFGDPDDPLAEWNRRSGPRAVPATPGGPPPADEAPTESIPRPRVEDTAVMPQPGPRTPPLPVAAPPPAHVPASPPAGRRFPLGATLALLGAMAVLFSALLEWAPGAEQGPGAAFPRDIPFRRLLDVEAVGPGISLGLVLLVAGVAGALLALLTMVVPALKFLRRLVGLACLALPVLFAFRAAPSFGEIGRLPELLGVGVYVAAVGAFVQVVAGRWFRR